MAHAGSRAAFAAVMVTTAAIALTACSNTGGVGGAKTATQESATAGGTTTLTYETWYPDEKTLQTAIAGFEAANPGIKVNLRVLASQDFQKQLPLQLNSGEALDVVGVQVSAMTKTVGPQLIPVEEWAGKADPDWKSKLDPKLLEQSQKMSKDGTLAAIPMGAVASAFMYYNNDILKKAGVQPPTTVAELAAAVKKIKAAEPEVTTPVAFSGEGWWQEEVMFSFAGQKTPNLSDDLFHGSGSWDSPDVVAGMNAYKSLFTSGAVSTDVLSLKGSDANKLFYSGKSAFFIGGGWEASVLSSSFRKANSVVGDDFGVVPVPLADGATTPAVRTLAEGGLGIPKSSKHVTEAAKFIAYMTYGPGVDLWNANLVYTPVAKVGWTAPDTVLTTDAAKTGLALMTKVASAPGSMRDSQQDFLNNVEGPTIVEVLRGKKSADAAARELQAAWTSGRYPHGSQ